MDSAMGTLCQYCKILEIDDAAWEGYRDESIPGKNVLAFSPEFAEFSELADHVYLGDDRNSEFLEKYPGSHGPARIWYFTCHYGREDTFPELPNLKKSAAGCGFCALLRDWIRWQSYKETFRFNDPDRPIFIRSFEFSWYEAIGKNDVPFRIFLGIDIDASWDEGSPSSFSGPKIRIYAPNGPCATWLSIPRREPPKIPDLWEKISMINSSLWKCSNECGHRKYNDSIPSRLIYVGEKTEFGFGDPRLVVLSDPEHLPEDCTKDNIEYAVLSYCWGESRNSALTTTMGNLAAHLKKIPLAKMPATSRDAILVTRALGLKWLWIDAFCIIQGNNADWHSEAAEMAGVYGNAFVTIIPLRSLSSHDGFLDQLKMPAVARIPFKSSIDPSVEGYYTLRTQPDEWDDHGTLERELCSSKWQSRGWTYQEDTMSQRKLYFGETDIYFRCGSERTITCQSSATMPSKLDGESWPLAERRGTTTIAERTKIGWYQSLNNFCLRDLTFKTDAFPAISAIAKMHCNDVQEDYQCGLWRSDLHNGVFWESEYGKSSPEEHMKRLTSQNDYVAPSWSWASVYAMGYSIRYASSNRSPLWKILETEALLVDASNPLGPVLSGHILVRGRWCALSSLRLRYSSGSVYKGDKEFGRCFFDWNGAMTTQLDGSEILPASYTERLVILLVAEYTGEPPGGVAGILLIPSVEGEAWCRVGLFRTWFYEAEYKVSKEDKCKSFRAWKEGVFKIV